jgi:tRNA nucleotidyltransferase (CCA-adding enzyme)
MSNELISKKSIHPLAIEACHTLQNAGFQAFIVGGCVRDLIMQSVPKDWDITTNALPEQVIKLFPKNYPTGLQHGTVTVALGSGVENHFEITTFRTEGTYKDGRRPEEVFFVNNIDLDLSRRDFTINSMAFDPINGHLIDPFNGISDLKEGIIKAVGSPIERFTEDGLRIMRAARFAARFGFEIEKETINAMGECLETLKKVSKERIKDEFCKTLMTNHSTVGFNILLQTGVLDIICPVLTSKPPYTGMIRTLSSCQSELETRIAMLYSNCPSFLIKQIEQELINLKFSNKELKQIYFLLELDAKFFKLISLDGWSKEGFIAFIAHIKNEMGDEWEHTMKEFIKLMEPISFLQKDKLSQYHQQTVLSKKEMNIDGNDLISLGIKPGPQIKIVLNLCYEEILYNPNNNTKEYLIELVNSLINIEAEAH